MDSTPVTARLLGRYFMIDGDELERSYKHHLSDYAVNGNQKCSDFGNSECSIFGIKTTVLLASAVQ